MKASLTTHKNGDCDIKLTPETVEECAQILFHRLNANAEARKVSTVWAESNNTVSMIICLQAKQQSYVKSSL